MIQRIVTSISTHLRSSRHRLQVCIFTRDRLPSITRNERFENDLWTIQSTMVNNFFAFPRDGINLSNAVGARERWTRHVFSDNRRIYSSWAFVSAERARIRHVPFPHSMIDPWLLLISLDDVLRDDLLVRETEELTPVSSVLRILDI